MNLFALRNYRDPSISLAEQRRQWGVQFLKAFLAVFLGYMAMYLIRNNFKAAGPMLKEQLDMTTTELGLIGLGFSITYGGCKALVGFYIDGKNTKKFLAVLLALSSLSVLTMGLVMSFWGSPIGILITLWGLNGLFQCAGGPASYSALTRWTPRVKRGRYLGLWNMSHNVGGGLAGALALWGANVFFDGNVVGMFIFPSIIALVIAGVTYYLGKGDPRELGWGRAEEIFDEAVAEMDRHESESKWQMVKKHVLLNPFVWILCISNIFVYVIRIGVDNWAPLYVSEQFNWSRSDMVNTIFYFEMGALVASLFWGYISDLLKGRRAIVAVGCFILIIFALMSYRYSTSVFMINASLVALGLLIFGPQLMITIALVDFVPKNAVSMTTGLSGCFAYLLGDSIAKVYLAMIADPEKSGVSFFNTTLHGWHDVFVIFYCCVFCGIVLLSIVAFAEEKRIRAAKKAAVSQETATQA
jgi:OPA family hexose phosphate transport protein UhpT-like MFS transporter